MKSPLALRLSLALGLFALAACEPDAPKAQYGDLFANALQQEAAPPPQQRITAPLDQGYGEPPTAGSAGLRHGALSVHGLQREYLYYAPSGLSPDAPVALLLAFHGGGGTAENFANTADFQDLARQKGFIVIYPQGLGRNGQGGTWTTGDEAPGSPAVRNGVDDVAFVRALLDQFSEELPVDPHRIFATGMSRGGMLTYRLACEMSDRITAIAPVAGTLTLPDCRPQHPVALLHIHGSQDQHVPFEGGRGKYTARKVERYRSAKEGIEILRKVSGAGSEVRSQRLSDDTQCYYYAGGKAPIGYCIVEGGGHAWPGAEKKRWQEMRDVQVTRSFSVTELIWEFFEQSAERLQEPPTTSWTDRVFGAE